MNPSDVKSLVKKELIQYVSIDPSIIVDLEKIDVGRMSDGSIKCFFQYINDGVPAEGRFRVGFVTWCYGDTEDDVKAAVFMVIYDKGEMVTNSDGTRIAKLGLMPDDD